MTNILCLHNGLRSIKPFLQQQYPQHRLLPNIADAWPGQESIEQRIEYLKHNDDVIFDLTPADRLPFDVLCQIGSHCHVIKIVTHRDQDLSDLEDSWDPTHYDDQQWKQAAAMRFWMADQVVYYKYSMTHCKTSTIGPATVFTPGRSGSHVLMSTLGINTLLHHDLSIITSDRFQQLLDSRQIHTVLRKSLWDHVASLAVANRFGFMVTHREKLSQHRALAQEYRPFSVTENDISGTLETLCYFVDVLLSLDRIWQKKIEFCYLEDLSNHFDRARTVKNPYDLKSIIENHDEMRQLCQDRYQPIYRRVLDRCGKMLGVCHY